MCVYVYIHVSALGSLIYIIPATQTTARVHVRECCASAMTLVCISCYAPEDKARVAVSNICEMATREPSLSCSFKFRQCCFMRHEIPALVVIHKRHMHCTMLSINTIPIFFIHCLFEKMQELVAMGIFLVSFIRLGA